MAKTQYNADCPYLCIPQINSGVAFVQLNKRETDPYFLQNFQCTTMFISTFCKIHEQNTEHEIGFVLISIDFQGDIKQM